jgi:TATA-box binding protein (TBP) (component of TFIID and TFIIIB)
MRLIITTTIVKINEDKFMNIKLFKNSSIQITGCKSLDDCNIGLNKIIKRLKEVYSYIDEEGEFIDIKFVENIEDIKISRMKIVMINSNFTINYCINREILYNILRNEHVNCRYNPSSHACVNIKFKSSNDHKVSIFVFQTGKIIITGAKNLLQIKEAYNYIYTFLQKNKNKIIKKDISKLLSNNDYLEVKNSLFNDKINEELEINDEFEMNEQES